MAEAFAATLKDGQALPVTGCRSTIREEHDGQPMGLLFLSCLPLDCLSHNTQTECRVARRRRRLALWSTCLWMEASIPTTFLPSKDFCQPGGLSKSLTEVGGRRDRLVYSGRGLIRTPTQTNSGEGSAHGDLEHGINGERL